MHSRAGKSQSSTFPVKISIDHEDVVRVILKYLHGKGHISAMRALEKESGVEAERLGEDAAFLRALVLDGLWDDAITLIEPLRPGTAVHNRASFEIRKQEFLEMLETEERGDNAAALVKALQRLESGSSRQEFNDLCYCLTLPDLRGHPEYASWTPQLGRLWCFEALRGYLSLLFPGQETPTEVIPEDQLELLCRQACMYQAEQRRRKHPDTFFPRIVTGGILSEVWAPKPARSGGGSSASGSRGVPRAANNGQRKMTAPPPNSAPALGGFHCGRLDDCEPSGLLNRRTSSQPFRWMLSCVSGDRSDISPRSVGPHVGPETSQSDIQQFPAECVSPVLKGSPIDLAAGDTKGTSDASGGARPWSNSAATTVLGASFQGNRGVPAAAAAAAAAAANGSAFSRATGRESPMPKLFSTRNASASRKPPSNFPREDPAVSPSRAAAPPQLEQLTPRWPVEWRSVNEENNAHGSPSRGNSNEGDRDPFCPAAGANGVHVTAARTEGGYTLLARACSFTSERDAGRSGEGSERRRDTARESVTPFNVSQNPNVIGAARGEGEGGGGVEQRASSGTPIKDRTAAERSMESERRLPMAWETSMTSTDGESTARSAQGTFDEEETGTGLGSENSSHETSETELREEHGGGVHTTSETPSPLITTQSQPWDPPTTTPVRSTKEFDEANEAGANPQPRQTAGQYDRLSRLDHQPGRTEGPIDQGLTEGGENTSQHHPEPPTFPRPLLTISAPGDGDETKADTPEGNAPQGYSYSHAEDMLLDPVASGVGGAGSADGCDGGEGSGIASDILKGEFDEIMKEDASRFVPTVVFRASQVVRSVGFSSDGALFAAGSNDRALRVCRTPSESELACAEVVDQNSGMRTFDAQTVLRSDDHHRASIYCLAFSPDSALIATGSNDKMVKLLRIPHRGAMTIDDPSPYYEMTHAQDEIVLRGHSGTIRDLCFPSPAPTNHSAGEESGGGAAHNRRLLTAGAGDFACRVWDVEGVPLAGRGGEAGLEPLVVFRGHTDTVFSCSLLPGGEVAVTGGADSVVRVWDARTGGGVRSLIVKDQEVLCVRPWPRDPERLMMTSHSDGQCFLWDMRTGRALSSVSSHKNQTRALDFSPNGHSLLTASHDGLIGVSECREEPWTRSVATTGLAGTNADDNGGRQVSVSTLAMLRAHGGRMLQARWRPTAPAAFITSSTDCAVLLWTISDVGMGVQSY